MGSKKQIATGYAWTTLVNIINGVYGFISVPILIAYFGKADYGLIGLALSVNVYLRLMDIGMTITNIRYFATWITNGNTERVNRLLQTSMVFYGSIGLINGAVLLIVSFFVDSFFNLTPEQVPILKTLLYILAISAVISWLTSSLEQLIKATENVGWAQKMTLLPKTLQIVILVLTVTVGFSIEVYYALTTFSMFAVLPFFVRKIKQLCPYVNFKLSFDKDIFKEILPYSLQIFSFGFFQFTIVNLRPVLLGMQSTTSSVADYRILNGIVQIVIMLGGSFINIMLPSATKAVARKDKEAREKIAYQGTKYITVAISFMCFAVMSVSPELLTMYVGKEYLYLTIWLDLWLLTTLATHNQAISSLILAGAKIKAVTINTTVSAIIGLIVCWYLIPVYDVGATVIGYGTYLLLQLLFYYLYYWPQKLHINSMRVFITSFLPYSLLGLLVVIFIRNIPSISSVLLLDVVIKIIIFVLLYSIGTILLFNKENKRFVLSLFNNN